MLSITLKIIIILNYYFNILQKQLYQILINLSLNQIKTLLELILQAQNIFKQEPQEMDFHY